jgi:RNA-directed DNA polymerase
VSARPRDRFLSRSSKPISCHVPYGFRPNRRPHDAIAEIHALTSRPRDYEWIVEADIAASFDEIDQVALMDRVRIRVKDKNVLALVKAFLKAGVLTRAGDRQETPTGTAHGGILSPLLANIALTVLDEHYARAWTAMGDTSQRHRRRKRGQATYRLIRYADDFVLLVKGANFITPHRCCRRSPK